MIKAFVGVGEDPNNPFIQERSPLSLRAPFFLNTMIHSLFEWFLGDLELPMHSAVFLWYIYKQVMMRIGAIQH